MTRRRHLLLHVEAAEAALDQADHALAHLGPFRDRPSVRNAEARLEETRLWVAHAHSLISSDETLDGDALIPVVKD